VLGTVAGVPRSDVTVRLAGDEKHAVIVEGTVVHRSCVRKRGQAPVVAAKRVHAPKAQCAVHAGAGDASSV
jgi:hypothetical protein